MGEKYLTLKQNICAARIFLNTFELIIENVNDINEFSRINIYDKSMNIVGELYFENGRVIMSAEYCGNTLMASFDIAKIFGFVDIECGNTLFGQWSSKINFYLKNYNNIILSGEFLIGSTVDSQLGVTCLCHPLINLEIPNTGNIVIKILRDGFIFDLEIVSKNYSEKISIRPHSTFLLHDIKNGTYDEDKGGYPYRKYAVVAIGAECGENKDKLNVFLKEEEYDKIINFYNEFVPKVGIENSSEVRIQKGLLMQKLDNSAFEKIEQLRKLLLIDKVSLLDNLISVCYDSYTDEELNALLGIKREKNVYQDGADSLINSYFGIGSESQFLSLEEQKKLLKK